MKKSEHFDIAHEISSHEWKKRSAVITAIFALFIAMSSFGIENFNHHSIILKNEAVNQWGYFQSKSLKEKIAEMQNKQEDVVRYQAEQEEIKTAAETATKKSEDYDSQGNILEIARVLFELGIVLNAIFLLTDRRELFWTSIAIGILGIIMSSISLFI